MGQDHATRSSATYTLHKQILHPIKPLFGQCNHPVIGIRLGKGGVLKGIGASTMKILKALRTENINDITFKRRNQGQGIQYEIIIKTDQSVDVTLSPTLGAYMGKRANAEASLYSQLSTKHLNNILMVSGDVLNKRKSEQSTYDIHSKQTQVDVDDAEHGKSLNLNYDAEWSPNDAFSAGISTSYYTNRGQKSRISHEESASFHFEYAPITFEDVTGSLFFNWNKANHSLHGEISYNKSTSHTGLEVDGTFQQDIRQNSKYKDIYLEPEAGAFAADPIVKRMSKAELEKSIANTTALMKQAAKDLDFIQAAQYRDEIIRLQNQLKEKKY